MAVAAMSRLELYGLSRDLSEIMALLQQIEAVEVETAGGEVCALADPQAIAAIEREISELERTISSFDRVAPRRPNMVEQFAGVKTVLTEEEFSAFSSEAGKARETAEEARRLDAEIGGLNSRLSENKSVLSQLESWVGLGLTSEELAGTRHVRIILGAVGLEELAGFSAALRQAESRSIIVPVTSTEKLVNLAVLWPRDAVWPEMDASAGQVFGQITLPPFQGPINRAVGEIRAEIERLVKAIGKATDLAVKLARERARIEARLDHLRSELARLNAVKNLAETPHAFRLFGWLPSARERDLRQAIDQAGYPYALTTRPPEQGENVPIILRNSGPFEPFETLVKGFSYPRYEEIDPTRAMAPFFFLFFGFCLSDAGYGLVLILFSLGLLRWLKMGPDGRRLSKVFALGGLGAVLMGLVTGGIFGDLFRIKGLIDPVRQALVMMGIALGLGLIQLYLGTILAAVPSIRAGRWRDALFNQGVWLLFLSSILLLLGKGPLGLAPYGSYLNWLTLGSAAAVIYSATRDRRGILGKLLGIPAGLYNIYNSIGFFSDVMSYIRLMALGLSGGVMANVINLFVRMFSQSGNPAGIVAGVLIGLLGHSLNIALSILGAYVHSSRLQFLEFFGKFYEGGGRPFRPLRHEYKRVFVVKEREA